MLAHGVGLRVVSFVVALAMLVSTAGAGLHATTASLVVLAKRQLRPPNFSDSPRAIQYGAEPRREDVLRGGQWTPQTLEALKRAAAQWSDPARSLIASNDPEANLEIGYPGDEGAGYVHWWEGEYEVPVTPPGGGGILLKINTQSGNVQTPFHVAGWAARGDVAVNLTLYHNSKSTFNQMGTPGWSHSYQALALGSLGETVIVRWGDGTSHAYTFNDGNGQYVAPTGVFDKLTHVPGLSPKWLITRPDQSIAWFSYTTGSLQGVADRHGNTIGVSTAGSVTTVTDPTGRWITLTKTGSQLTGIADSSGRSWNLNYSGENVTFKLGTTTLWSATSSSGRLNTITDGRGKTWNFVYTSPVTGTIPYIHKITTPLGHETRFDYTTTNCTITLPGLQTQVHNYSAGKLVSQVDEGGFSASYGYGANNLVTSVTDERGKLWQFTYDSRGNMLTAKNPLNQTWTYTYNTLNDLLTAKDPLNNQTTLTVDAYGNVLTVTDPLSRLAATNSYDTYGQLTSTEDALDRVTTIGRNADGDVTTVTDPLNKTWTYSRGSLGRLTAVKDPLNNETTFAYDSHGRPYQLTHPGGAVASVGFDAASNVNRVTNELGRDTLFSYDDDGRLSTATNPRGDVETYTYNSNSWLTEVKDGNLHERIYTHTVRGEVSGLTLADGSWEGWTYDATGNPTVYTNPIAQQIAYGYDDAGRLTLVDYPTGTDTAFAYDSAGRPNTMTDGTGVTDWDFNAASELTKLTTPQGTMDYTYTLAGERATMVEQGVGTTSYQYWNDGRLKQLTNPYTEVTVWNYDAAGRLTKRTLGSGMYETYAYDVRSRLTSAGIRKADTTLLRWRGYSYDAASNVLTETLNSTTTTYTYDFADQLLSENRTGHSTAYTYDSNGNRLTRNINGVLETYSYDAGDKLLSVTSLAGSKTYTYEAGRVKTLTTGAGTTTFNYDYESRVTGIVYPTAATNSFAYNGLGSRTSKSDSTGTRTYKRDGAYVTNPVLSDGAANYTPTISERRSGATTYLHSGLKNADAQSNSSQTLAGTRAYDGFGAATASAGPWSGPFGYGGQYSYQEESDGQVLLLGHRYLDVSVGRFLSRDKLGHGRNWYVYCANSPLGSFDEDGQIFETILDIGGLGYDIYALIKEPSLENAGFMLWSAGSVVVPGAPGSYVGRAAKEAAKRTGRRGAQRKLRESMVDPSLSKEARGWLENERRQIRTGNRKTLRNPPGTELAHNRGEEAAKGFDYSHSQLRPTDLHRLQHATEAKLRQLKKKNLLIDDRLD